MPQSLYEIKKMYEQKLLDIYKNIYYYILFFIKIIAKNKTKELEKENYEKIIIFENKDYISDNNLMCNKKIQ